MSNQNNKQDISIAKLQTDVNWLKDEVTTIKDNHLPYLKEQIDSLENKILFGFVAVIAVSVLLKLFT